MIKVDLITGFLGSGKTTFIKKYARFLMNRGQKIGILENDYGAVNVDMMLLQDLIDEGCDIEMVAGGCDYDCHKRRFKTKLIAMGMLGYNRVLIEPSGIFDTDEFFDVLYEEPLDKWYETGNVIAIVDAMLDDDLSEQSEYLLASQLANAGTILLSRVQQATDDDIDRTINHIKRTMQSFGCNRNIDDIIIAKDWDELADEDFEKILNCSYVLESHIKLAVADDNSYSSLYFMNKKFSIEKLADITEKLLSDKSCGNVFRIKGFMQEGDSWLELNATKNEIELKPIKNGQQIIIVIGENLNEGKINSYFE